MNSEAPSSRRVKRPTRSQCVTGLSVQKCRPNRSQRSRPRNRLNETVFSRAAGIPRSARPARSGSFHSLRQRFERIAIEHNRPIFRLSKHLGHSSLDVTSNVYGHFEKATRKREAEAMAGVFGV